MKTMLIFPVFAFATCDHSSFDRSNVAGKYFSVHKVYVDAGNNSWSGYRDERADLQLNADSTFSLDVEFAGSDFPGEYKGRWKLFENTVLLHDTTGNGVEDMRFTANDNGTLSGKYGADECEFNHAEK